MEGAGTTAIGDRGSELPAHAADLALVLFGPNLSVPFSSFA